VCSGSCDRSIARWIGSDREDLDLGIDCPWFCGSVVLGGGWGSSGAGIATAIDLPTLHLAEAKIKDGGADLIT